MEKDKRLEEKVKRPATIWPNGFVVSGNRDPLGSYTGIAKDPFETPVQDADDL